MSKYKVYNAMDPKKTELGVLTTGEDGIAKEWVNADGEDDGRFLLEIEGKETVEHISSHVRMMTFVPTGETLAKALAEARERRGLEKVEAPVVEEQTDTVVKAEGGILKTDPAKRHVFGWAYVTHDKNGDLNIDKSGDFIDEVEEIEKAGYDFVLKSRAGDADHTNVKGADMIESIVFTPEKIEKMGLPEGSVPVGWWLGFKVHDDATWARVESGELRAFSIHGKGTRAKVEE